MERNKNLSSKKIIKVGVDTVIGNMEFEVPSKIKRIIIITGSVIIESSNFPKLDTTDSKLLYFRKVQRP